MKLNKLILSMVFTVMLNTLFFTHASAAGTRDTMLKVSYLQMDASGSLSSITPSGYNASNVIIFAFANLDSAAVNPNFLSAMQTAINNKSPGTLYFLSIGGQYANSSTININTAPAIIDKVYSQITAYNSQLSSAAITGVDLDLENEIDAPTITALAQGFKARGLLVSTAPQVINVDPNIPNVDADNPFNLGLTSGGNHNQYGPAIAAGYVDYIMAQTYNSGGWTVGGVSESQPNFFSFISLALGNAVRSSCVNVTTLCIPNTVKIVIGEVSNAGASGNPNNIFGSDGQTPYNQAAVLSNLSTQVSNVIANYPHIYGVMQWSLNNDYMPNAWGDAQATPGAFSTAIFGATPPPALPYFILQVTNTGPNQAGPVAYASATLIVNGQYWIFGANAPWVPAGMAPIAPNPNGSSYQLWGTLPSSQNPTTPNVVDSGNLDAIFSNGVTSFATAQILINGYSSYDSNIMAPSGQWNCLAGAGYTFEAGHAYNLMINPVYQSCAISKVN
jgi:hypothetical protein